MRKTRDLAIFVMMTDRRQTKPIALPLAHVCGVMNSTFEQYSHAIRADCQLIEAAYAHVVNEQWAW